MRSKVFAVVEVVLVFVGLIIIVRAWHLALGPLARWQSQNLYWNYFGHTIQIGIALLLVFIPKRNPKTFGLTLTNFKYNLVVGWSVFAVLVGLPIFAGWAFGNLALHPTYGKFIIPTIIFQFFFSGLGEEIVFRGYMQSRLNETLGRPFHIFGINFGVGLIIASLLFVFAHVLNPFNPFAGAFVFDWWWGLEVLPWGLFFGLVREKTGSILAPGIIHGYEAITDLIASNLTTDLALWIAIAISWFLLFAIPRNVSAERSGES